jgi:hypothetical protein
LLNLATRGGAIDEPSATQKLSPKDYGRNRVGVELLPSEQVLLGKATKQ